MEAHPIPVYRDSVSSAASRLLKTHRKSYENIHFYSIAFVSNFSCSAIRNYIITQASANLLQNGVSSGVSGVSSGARHTYKMVLFLTMSANAFSAVSYCPCVYTLRVVDTFACPMRYDTEEISIPAKISSVQNVCRSI